MERPPDNREARQLAARLLHLEETLSGERWLLREARIALTAATDEAARRRFAAAAATHQATVLGLVAEVMGPRTRLSALESGPG